MTRAEDAGQAPPPAGAYALGVEPWTSTGNLADALATGRAIVLEPGGSVETALVAAVESYDAADGRHPSRARRPGRP